MILVFAFLAILSSAHARCSPWWGSLTCSECVVRKSLFQPCGWILTNPEDTNSGKCGRANGKKGQAAKIIDNLMTTKEMCANLDGVNSAALSISAQVAAEISPTDEQMDQVVQVTGLSKEKAIKLLKEIGGNVQAAIESHIEGGSAALISNSNEAMRGSAPTETASDDACSKVLVLAAGELSLKTPDKAMPSFYSSMCFAYKLASQSATLCSKDVHIVSVYSFTEMVEFLKSKAPQVTALCQPLLTAITTKQIPEANIHSGGKYKLSVDGKSVAESEVDRLDGNTFATSLYDVIEKTGNAARELMVVFMAHGLIEINTMQIEIGKGNNPIEVTRLRSALDANTFKSVVFVADFCYASMIPQETKPNEELPAKFAAHLHTGLATVPGITQAQERHYCTCKGDSKRETTVLKSNIVFFGAPKYVEGAGALRAINEIALAASLFTCAKANQLTADQVFALGSLQKSQREALRNCLPKTRHKMIEFSEVTMMPLSNCSAPDVCMYVDGKLEGKY